MYTNIKLISKLFYFTSTNIVSCIVVVFFFKNTVQIEDELEMMETKRINGEKLKELKKIALNQEKDIEDNKNEQKQKERMEIPDEEQKIILSELIFELQMVKTSLLVADSHRLGFKIGTYILYNNNNNKKENI